MNIGDLIACAVWAGICLVIRHEYVEQHRPRTSRWGGPR